MQQRTNEKGKVRLRFQSQYVGKQLPMHAAANAWILIRKSLLDYGFQTPKQAVLFIL
jgi:hypothetical protein